MNKIRDWIPWRPGESKDRPAHRFGIGDTVYYAVGVGTQLVILQRITRESRLGIGLSYQCRQIVNGLLSGQRLELDESELQPALSSMERTADGSLMAKAQ